MRPVWVGKRKGNRTACLLKAQVFVAEGEMLGEAQILDLSPTGARIRLASDLELPAMFQLHIPSRMETRHCKQRWRRDALIGVEFFRSAEIAVHQTMDQLTHRIERLEAQLSQLLDSALAAPSLAQPAPAPAGTDALADDLQALSRRLERMEHDHDRLNIILQDHVHEVEAQNLSARFAGFETKNEEILMTLRKLIPILSRQAA